MHETIKNFPNQFSYVPEVVRGEKLSAYGHVIVAGMGGSGLAALLLKAWKPELPLSIYQDYGLPIISDGYHGKTLIIASSYSGNTEEVIDVFTKAIEKQIPVAVITTGGTLGELAEKHQTPLILLPNTGIQPRSARGYSFMALLKMLGDDANLTEAAGIAKSLDAMRYEEQGRALASWLSGAVPIIYSSRLNHAIAYNWKITFNETGKVPAFCNSFPELNHNEMAGFDAHQLVGRFRFVFLRDSDDNDRVKKRMEVLESLYRKRELPVESLDLHGASRLERIFSTLVIADWAAYHLAVRYGFDPENMPIVEEFKKLI
ncbi:MAG: bifunctional phosphoglucose/phosphomannose isomerase [Patescibacteria group bacterium]